MHRSPDTTRPKPIIRPTSAQAPPTLDVLPARPNAATRAVQARSFTCPYWLWAGGRASRPGLESPVLRLDSLRVGQDILCPSQKRLAKSLSFGTDRAIVGFTEQQARRITAFVDTVRLWIIEVRRGQFVLPALAAVAAFALVSPSCLKPPNGIAFLSGIVGLSGAGRRVAVGRLEHRLEDLDLLDCPGRVDEDLSDTTDA
jgi:hypothetical protein